MSLTRHVGRDHLGNRIIVIFRELPEDPSRCLVVETDRLPEIYHDNLMAVVNSTEAQQTHNLYEVLDRRLFGDGTRILQTLHQRGYIKSLNIDQVMLIPMPNRELPLREANAAIAGTPVEPAPQAQEPAPVPAPAPVADDAELASDQGEPSPEQEAQRLVEMARLMEADAKGLREKAYALDPSLKAGGRPAKKTRSKNKAEKSSDTAES